MFPSFKNCSSEGAENIASHDDAMSSLGGISDELS
jgi:hypothetical protein